MAGFPIFLTPNQTGVKIGSNGLMSGYALSAQTPSFMQSGQGASAASGAPAASAGMGANIMGGASIGLAVGQALGGLYSAYVGGKTTEYVSKKQAQIAENNRQMGQLSYESALRSGEAQIAQLTYQAGQLRGRQRQTYGRSGAAVGEGSSAEVLASTEVMKQMDVNTASLNALSNAWGYKNAALQAGAQSATYSSMGDYARGLSYGKMAGSLLEGGAEVADRWYKYFGS